MLTLSHYLRTTKGGKAYISRLKMNQPKYKKGDQVTINNGNKVYTILGVDAFNFSRRNIIYNVSDEEGFYYSINEENIDHSKSIIKKEENTQLTEKPSFSYQEPEYENTLFSEEIDKVQNSIRDLLIEKNKSYGDSALNPIRCFSKADSIEQIRVRLDDKISRLIRGKEYLGDNDIDDIHGYIILLKIANNRKNQENGNQ